MGCICLELFDFSDMVPRSYASTKNEQRNQVYVAKDYVLDRCKTNANIDICSDRDRSVKIILKF